VYAESIETNELITHLSIQSSWGHARIQTSLLGEFNLENILAAFSVLCVSGVSIDKAAKSLSSFMGIPGRMEYFLSENKPMVVVDYAHTPDALEKALLTLRPYCNGQLRCVFGCGGDRDVGKRAQMGAIAEAFSDQIVLTDDNPRSERPEKIIEDILEGIRDKTDVSIRHDRSDAITNTFINAGKDDVILIAGKGHEITQEIGDQILPFSDRELARRLTESDK
ncbi:MAG: UDP-N-acetylmuramyl-tripeptide synthetase, partial [Proteobacteria bacterium]|nr:UDP-N-acetylmuramyl-tripeptide synthetase [Pseudomonadota bacterium]